MLFAEQLGCFLPITVAAGNATVHYGLELYADQDTMQCNLMHSICLPVGKYRYRNYEHYQMQH